MYIIKAHFQFMHLEGLAPLALSNCKIDQQLQEKEQLLTVCLAVTDWVGQ